MSAILEQRNTEYNILVTKDSYCAKWCSDIFKHPEVIPINEFIDNINDLFIRYVGADCWAVTYNYEVMYNGYDTKSLICERIMDNWYREYLCTEKTAKYVFSSLMKLEDKIRVYMFGTDGYFVEYELVQIDNDHKGIKINIYISEGYYNDYKM